MTVLTKSGIFIRDDGEINGMQVFSPFTGLFYSISPDDSKQVLDWLNNKISTIDEKYINTIGLEWMRSIEDAPITNLNVEHNLPLKILVINWLVTGECTHSCKYCYAHDFTGKGIFYDEKTIDSAIETMLNYDPLAIVLSGGEPTLNPKLKYIIKKLKDRVGIILDTNGCLLTPEDIDYFNENKVVIRISLDTLIPKNNYRIPKNKNKIIEYENRTIESINMCISKKSSLVIHTVVNDKNRNDLISMGNKLNYLGLKIWKLIEVVKTDSEIKIPSASNFENVINNLNISKKKWKQMRVIYQRTESNVKQVILLMPNGHYCTQGSNGKIILDLNLPNSPKTSEILKNIIYDGHIKRYLETK